MSLRTVTLILSLASVGLMAGLFFGWLVSVIPGLRRVADGNYVSTMQHINRAIVNPAFVIPFVLTPVLLAIAAVAQFRFGEHRRAWFLVASALSYVVGVLGVTAGGNIPLNNTLDSFDCATATAEMVSSMREDYETWWNRWHSLRTAASMVSFTLASVAAVIRQGDV